MALIERLAGGAVRKAQSAMRIEPEVVGPVELVDALRHRYPALLLSPGLLRFALHLLRTPVRYGDVVPVPNKFLGDLYDRERQARNNRFRSLPEIEKLAGSLAAPAPGNPPIDVELYPFDYRNGISYAVGLTGVPPDLTALARVSRDVPDDDRITLDGWVRVTVEGGVRELYGETPTTRAAMESALRPAVNAAEITLRLQGYLNGLATAVFAPIRDAIQSPETGAYVRAEFPDGAKRGMVVATLRDVLRQPVPIYQTSPKTPRLHAIRRNLTGLPSALRQRLTDEVGWVELDLAHAQLACNATAWGVDGALDVLNKPGYELWPDLVEHLGADPTGPHYAQLKGILKPVVHGISFGMRAWKAGRLGLEVDDPGFSSVAEVVRAATGLSVVEAGRRLMTHEVVGAMLKERERQRSVLYEEKGRADVFGTWHPMEKKSDWKRVLARCSQAHEMALLEPVIDDAIAESKKKRPRYRLALWQHDGFTAVPKEKDDAGRRSVSRRLQRLVADRAASMGVPTRLKEDVGPGPK